MEVGRFEKKKVFRGRWWSSVLTVTDVQQASGRPVLIGQVGQ